MLIFFHDVQAGSKEKDAVITKAEFERYYANLSASIDRDDYFELMIRNAWHISGGEGWAANTTNRRVLVTHADGRQTVEEIKVHIVAVFILAMICLFFAPLCCKYQLLPTFNAYYFCPSQDDLGLRAGDQKGMVQRLKAQGLNVATINTNGAGDLDNQFEAPDSYNYRSEVAAAQRQMQAQAQQQQSPYQPGNSFASGPSGRPGTVGNKGTSTGTGPRRLADFAGAPSMQLAGSAYTEPVPAHRHLQQQQLQQRPLSAAGTQVLKPTSLANFIESNNNNVYSARSNTSSGSGRRR